MHKTTLYNKEIKENTTKIDAKNKVLGKLAVQVADILRGKNRADFSYHQIPLNKVIVYNVKHIAISGTKLHDKKYYHHTGYLGNLKTEVLGDLMQKNPEKVFIHAVSGMLPKNRLQAKFLANLKVYKEDIKD